MKLSISAIAWDPSEDIGVAAYLKTLGVTGVETVPPRIVLTPKDKLVKSCKSYLAMWEANGIALSSMQALLFGHPEFSLFESESSRTVMLNFLQQVFTAGELLGVKRYVFGSPKNRLKRELPYTSAFQTATGFFRSAAVAAHKHGGCLCIEANPSMYGCDFITTSEEAAQLTRAVKHPGFGLHLDTGGIHLAKDDPVEIVKKYGAEVKHFHISAPNLDPIYDYDSNLRLKETLNALKNTGYSDHVSIEMKKAADGDWKTHLKKAVTMVQAAIRF